MVIILLPYPQTPICLYYEFLLFSKLLGCCWHTFWFSTLWWWSLSVLMNTGDPFEPWQLFLRENKWNLANDYLERKTHWWRIIFSRKFSQVCTNFCKFFLCLGKFRLQKIKSSVTYSVLPTLASSRKNV